MRRAARHPVVHLELRTGNLARACAFYTRLFGWRTETIHAGSGNYLALELGRRLGGGVVEHETECAFWLPYVDVPDVAEATERARALGASVLLPPREGPAGWRSVVAAPGGGTIALWQAKGERGADAQRTSRERPGTGRQSRMTSEADSPIWLATVADAPVFGRLLHAFNSEYGDPEPQAEVIAARAAPLIESGEVTVLFVGRGPDGFAELRFRPSLYTGALDAYLEELYVVPDRRGRGLGRALLEAAMAHARERGAARIDLGTSEDDVAARALYESMGFTNRERGPDGPRMLYYERDL